MKQDGSGSGAAGAGDRLSRAVAVACAAAGGVAALLFAAVAVVMVAQAGARAIRMPVVGGDEVTGWLSASAAFCALPYAFRHGAFIRMELLLSRLKGNRARIAELIALAVGTAWCATMAFAMARFVWQNAVFGERSSGLLSIPIWPVQTPAVIGLTLLAVAMAEQLLATWRGQTPIYVLEAQKLLASDDRHSASL
jgi:TRAP-type C4-dicarboxylate transport system permease small subunit